MSDEQGENTVVHSFPNTNGEEIQIAVRKYQGKHYVDLRHWFQSKEGDPESLRPTKRGVFLPVERLPELKTGVDLLMEACDKIPEPAPTKH